MSAKHSKGLARRQPDRSREPAAGRTPSADGAPGEPRPFPGSSLDRAMGPVSRSVRLEVVEGADAGATFDLSRPDVYLIGRGRGEVPLTDPSCSGKHAQLEVLGHGECFVQDLSSSSGTYLNGVRVRRRRVCDGDELQVGESRLRFRHRGGGCR